MIVMVYYPNHALYEGEMNKKKLIENSLETWTLNVLLQ